MRILVSACLLGVSCAWDGKARESEAVLALRKNHELIPFCPEICGGLSTPRAPAEQKDGRVVTNDNADVTEAFEKGAREAARLFKLLDCECAILQDRSPSCGSLAIYDGSFTGRLIQGDGLTAKALKEIGARVLTLREVKERGVCPCEGDCPRRNDCAACQKRHANLDHPSACGR